ncbi:hypothetical protein D3C86_2179980 [compost metagenome]
MKSINGGAVCNENCPPGPYGLGPGFPRSCEAYNALPKCCQSKVLVHMDCVDGGLS